MRLALAALALAAALPADARAASVEPAAEASDGLDRLVALLVPEDAMASLAASLVAHRADRMPETRALQARYPGLRAHVSQKLEPALRKTLGRELPALRREIGTILAAEMTAAEIAETAAFLASPAGRKAHAGALRTLAEKPGMSDAEAGEAMLAAAIANVSLRDYPAVMAFAASGPARKMGGINPKVAAASRGWADRLVEKNEGKIAKLAKRATRDFTRRAGRERRA